MFFTDYTQPLSVERAWWESNPRNPARPIHQLYINFTSTLHQLYINFTSLLHHFYITFASLLHHFCITLSHCITLGQHAPDTNLLVWLEYLSYILLVVLAVHLCEIGHIILIPQLITQFSADVLDDTDVIVSVLHRVVRAHWSCCRL